MSGTARLGSVGGEPDSGADRRRANMSSGLGKGQASDRTPSRPTERKDQSSNKHSKEDLADTDNCQRLLHFSFLFPLAMAHDMTEKQEKHPTRHTELWWIPSEQSGGFHGHHPPWLQSSPGSG